MYCNNIQELKEELQIERAPEQWRLFIDLSKGSWNSIAYDFGERALYSFEAIITIGVSKGVNKITTSKSDFPGWDSTKSPGRGYVWRGNGSVGSSQGSWYNPKTGVSLHPDLNHPAPITPHWDYSVKGVDGGFRIFPDGTWGPK